MEWKCKSASNDIKTDMFLNCEKWLLEIASKVTWGYLLPFGREKVTDSAEENVKILTDPQIDLAVQMISRRSMQEMSHVLCTHLRKVFVTARNNHWFFRELWNLSSFSLSSLTNSYQPPVDQRRTFKMIFLSFEGTVATKRSMINMNECFKQKEPLAYIVWK